ncbi:MAG: carbon-nitrogen hydrolase family protein [Ruminococcus callidus]
MTCGFRKCFGRQHRKTAWLLVPANWLHQRTAHRRILLRARAIENQVYVLGVNCVGRQQSYTFDGQSCLVNPEGELLCTCGGEKQLVYVTIADDTEQFRQAFPTCRDVKIPLYRKLYEDIF